MSRQLDRFAQIHADLPVQSDGCLRPFRPLLGQFDLPRNVGGRLLIPAANWIVFCFLFRLFRFFRLLLDGRRTLQLDYWFDDRRLWMFQLRRCLRSGNGRRRWRFEGNDWQSDGCGSFGCNDWSRIQFRLDKSAADSGFLQNDFRWRRRSGGGGCGIVATPNGAVTGRRSRRRVRQEIRRSLMDFRWRRRRRCWTGTRRRSRRLRTGSPRRTQERIGSRWRMADWQMFSPAI